MKKLISIILAMLMLTACANAEAAGSEPNVCSGYWLDSWSGRANMTITFDGEQHRAVIRWANSAFESIQWEMTGRFEEGVLHAQDCVKTSRVYSEDGSEQAVILYENEDAALALNDGVITWTDPEGMGSECRFERYDEIDMRDVYNPERYAHMYITDIYAADDGALYCQGTLGTIHENGVSEGFDLRKALTLRLSAGSETYLPASLSDTDALDLTDQPASWFDAQAGNASFGFYAILTMNESGEIIRLIYSEDQPDQPVMTIEEEDLIIAPVPPSGR